LIALVVSAQLAALVARAAAPAPEDGGRRAPAKAAAHAAGQVESPRKPAASAKKSPANPPPTHVEADHIEYRYKQRETVMTGKPLVTLIREDAKLVCRKLVAENDEAGEIQHAVCEGDVKLTRGERIVTCARATYAASTGRVVCRGDPVLTGGDPVLRDAASVMACDELVYELDEDRVLLTRPKGTLVQKPGQGLPVAKGRAR
jgi:lipopolysaccharide export system protein LptA